MTGLVIRREVIERLKARSFMISSTIYLLVALAAVVIPHLVNGRKTVYGVGIVGTEAAAVEQAIGQLAPVLKVDLRTQRYDDEAGAEAALRAKQIDVVLVDASRALTRGTVPTSLNLLLNTTVYDVRLSQQLQSAGVSPGQVAALLTPGQVPQQSVVPAKPVRERNKPLAFAGVLVIYLLLLTYGFTVANGVLEEKSSRVSEILLGSVRPSQLLGGKVVGIGIVAVTQMVLIAVPTTIVALVLGSFHIPSGTPLTLLSVFLWAILGYGLYSCVFAAAGSAASRPEDVGNATAPITILIAVTYFTAIAAVQTPDGTLARIASFIPFMAPMTMLPRAAVGHVAPWEVPASVSLVLVTTYLTVRLGGRIYAGGIRRPGPRLKLSEAWKASAA